LEIFEGVLGGVKNFGRVLAQRCGDDGRDDKDDEEGSFFSALRPIDG